MVAAVIEPFIEELMDPAVWSDADIDAELRRIELEQRRLEARRAAVTAVATTRKLHRIDGHHGPFNHLRATCNSSRGETTRQLRLARLIDAIPTVGDALAAGHIGVAQAGELAHTFANPRVAHLLTAVAPLLLDHAEHLPFDDFRLCVQRWVMLADLDGAYRDLASDIEGRTARVVAVGSTLDVRAAGGDAVTAAKMIGIFERFVQTEFRKDVETRRTQYGDEADQHRLPRTSAQRNFDALEAIFDTAAAAPPGGRAPEPVVNIVGDARTVAEAFTGAGWLLPNGRVLDLDHLDPTQTTAIIDELTADPAALLDRRCETTSGIPVHPLLLLQAALAGHIRRIIHDSDGVVTDMGHRQRLFSGSPRSAATMLWRHCAHNGCDIPSTQCDVDHIDEWVDGGPTDQHNANPKCGKHDRFKHRRRWRSRRAANGRVYDLRPDGTIVLTVGERPPDLTADEMARLARRRLRDLIQR